jgi:hypothetical protein
MAATKGKRSVSYIEEFNNLMKSKTYESKVSSGSFTDIYEVEPVDIKTFIQSEDYLNIKDFSPSEAQMELFNSADDFTNGIKNYVVWVGKGGGKDASIRIMFLRLVYRLLCMYSPHKFFNMPSYETLSFLNVASSAEQAASVFFEPLKEILKKAGPKAFRDFGFKPTTDVFDKEVNFPKNIVIYSGNSEADSMEGKNLLVAVADEIDGTSFKRPDKMWSMMNSSSQSRFTGKQKIFAISYMRYSDSNGMIKKLHEEHQMYATSMAIKKATWEFNPTKTKEDFKDEFDKIPEEAATIYGCDPPGASIDAWIKDLERIRKSMRDDRWPLKFPLPEIRELTNYPMKESERYVNDTYIKLDPYNLQFEDWFVGIPGVAYAFVGDPGLGNVKTGGDSYGIALGHREILRDANGKKIIRPVIDFVFRFTGYMFQEREIQLDAVQNLIVQLKEKRGFDIRLFSFDQWNSASTAQWLRRRYPEAVISYKRFVDYEQYSLLKEQIFGELPPSSGVGQKLENGGIDWIYHPILYKELTELKEDRVKKKVDHPDSGSKDMADPVASLVYHAVKNWPSVGIEVSAGFSFKGSSNIKFDEEKPSELSEIIKKLEAKSKELKLQQVKE